MTDEQKAFIKENKQRMTKSQRYTVGELTMIYQIYNSITGESKTKSTCGRCLQNTISSTNLGLQDAEIQLKNSLGVNEKAMKKAKKKNKNTDGI